MRTLPQVYSQRDPRWASQRLGTVNGTTIGQEGCYISCFAMLACYYGHNVTPADIDNDATNKLYVDGNEATDDMLQKIFSDCQYQQSFDYSNTPADLSKLQALLSDPSISVILEIDFDHNPSDGIQSHFVIAVDCDGTNVTIADPWYGSVDPFTKNYGNNPSQTILKFVVYKGTPVSQGTYVDAETFTKLVDNSNVTDSLNDYFSLPHNSSWNTIEPKLDALKKAASDASQAATNAQNQDTEDKNTIQIDEQKITDLTAKIEQLNQSLAALQSAAQPSTTTDQTTTPSTPVKPVETQQVTQDNTANNQQPSQPTQQAAQNSNSSNPSVFDTPPNVNQNVWKKIAAFFQSL